MTSYWIIVKYRKGYNQLSEKVIRSIRPSRRSGYYADWIALDGNRAWYPASHPHDVCKRLIVKRVL